MNSYELYYIVKVDISEEKSQEVIDMFKNKMNEVIRIEHEGIKKLAYEVKGNEYGKFILIEFTATREKSVEIENLAKTSDDILKSIVMKISE